MKRCTNLSDFYPDDYVEWLMSSLRLTSTDLASDRIVEPLHHLHRTWMHGSGGTSVNYDDSALLCAYAVYYMTVQMPKLWFMFERCPTLADGVDTTSAAPDIIDLGCGPGTFTWAWLFYVMARSPGAPVPIRRVRCVDRSPRCLAVARQLSEELKRRYLPLQHVVFEFVEADWRDHIGAQCGVMIFGNVLVEAEESGLPMVPSSADNVVIIEPGTRPHFQILRHVRDAFIGKKWSITFPCTSANACPMQQDNWCHFHINRFVLPLIQRLSNRTGRRNPRHNFIGFVFARSSQPRDVPGWRVLSRLRRVKRSGVRYLCDGSHLVEAVLNRKDKNDTNRVFLTAEAGDAITIDTAGAPAADLVRTGRIRAGDRVRDVGKALELPHPKP